MTKNIQTPNQLLPKGGKVLGRGARRLQLRAVTKLFGTIKFEPGFSYKVERAKR